jgi:uncharacterized lipoprotein YmbA
MKFVKSLLFTAICTLTIWVFTGCSGSPAARFYLLQPGTDIDQTRPKSDSFIGLSLVKFPEYLDRSQIITYLSSHELHFAEYDRWAEPLEGNFKRVLIENLSAMIPTDNISMLPNERIETEANYINIEVIRFEYDYSGNVILVARWNIVKDLDQEFELDKYTELSLPATNTDYNKLVDIMSQLVYQLSREISDEINKQIK